MRRQSRLLRPKWTPPRAQDEQTNPLKRFLRSLRGSEVAKPRYEKFNREREAERRRRQIANGMLEVTP